jgi:hypothetical protein
LKIFLARLFYLHIERHNMQEALDEQKNLDEQLETTGRKPQGILIERPLSTSSDTHPVNGNYSLPDEDEDDDDDDDTEDDLILGDEDELSGDEEEFEVEVDEDIDEEDIDEDDLVIGTDDDDLDEDDDL